jgi:hypothetical protein
VKLIIVNLVIAALCFSAFSDDTVYQPILQPNNAFNHVEVSTGTGLLYLLVESITFLPVPHVYLQVQGNTSLVLSAGDVVCGYQFGKTFTSKFSSKIGIGYSKQLSIDYPHSEGIMFQGEIIKKKVKTSSAISLKIQVRRRIFEKLDEDYLNSNSEILFRKSNHQNDFEPSISINWIFGKGL